MHLELRLRSFLDCIETQWAISKQVSHWKYTWDNAQKLINKKAELSQRWPRDAPYTWVPWKFSRVCEYAHGPFSPKFLMGFCADGPANVPAKFEVRSFTHSWDNRRCSKNLGSPWIRPRSLFSKFVMGFFRMDPVNVPAKFEFRSFTRFLR